MHRIATWEQRGGATPAMHSLTAWAHWAVQLLQCTPSLLGAVGTATLAMHASLPRGIGWCNSYNALPHCLRTVALPHCLRTVGQCNSCNELTHCQCTTPTMHGLTASGQWAVQLLQCRASLPEGSGWCNSCNALRGCLGIVGQCKSCNAVPHCYG